MDQQEDFDKFRDLDHLAIEDEESEKKPEEERKNE
jgi:hypothetical protein